MFHVGRFPYALERHAFRCQTARKTAEAVGCQRRTWAVVGMLKVPVAVAALVPAAAPPGLLRAGALLFASRGRSPFAFHSGAAFGDASPA